MQITFPAKVARVIDGDTVELFAGVPFRLRMLDCWAPERRTPDGIKSREALEKLLPVDSYCDVTLDLEGCDRLGDLFTFGRILGRIRTNSFGDLSSRMCESGFATRTRNK